MQVSVIIPTKNEEMNLERLLKSILAQTFKDFEIVIVDNFSTDKTLKIASKFTKKIYKIGRERSNQRNYGLRKAKGKYILFLDADMELEETVIGECVSLMESNLQLSAIIIDELTKGLNSLSKIKALEKQLTAGHPFLQAPRFFKKADLQKIGGYDKKLISGEDWDLSQRMDKLGKKAKISSHIYHWENGSFRQDILKKYYYAQNIAKYAAKNPKNFKKQAGFNRFIVLFSRPKLILNNPVAFLGLLFLKTAHYFAYILASLGPKSAKV